MKLRQRLARWLAPPIDSEVNARPAADLGVITEGIADPAENPICTHFPPIAGNPGKMPDLMESLG
jgi:hypothetical protein